MAKKQKKTCFLISPIGPEGSDVRKLADDFLELLIEPALQPFGFEIIRADMIAGSSPINSVIVRYVQNSDLVVIDLTTHDPNVFYECGRRHENGRPFIQLIRKGEDLPFDVAGIRTITYDLSNPRSTLQSTREIQGFIEGMEKEGYEAGSTGESLSSIADGIRRIERELDYLKSEILGDQAVHKLAPGIKEVLTKHPIAAFNEAYEAGNLKLAVQLLPRIKKLIGDAEWLSCASQLAITGEPAGEVAILRALESPQNLNVSLIVTVVSCLRQYYVLRNLSQQGVITLTRILRELKGKLALTDKERADLDIQLAILQWAAHDPESALRTARGVLELNRDATNLGYVALFLSETGHFDEAAEYVDEMVKMPDVPEGVLNTAIKVYQHLGRVADASVVQVRLAGMKDNTGKEYSQGSAA